MQLHSFFNSSASYRVRIALGLKGLAYETVGVNIRSGEHKRAEHLALSPGGLVPALVDDGMTLSQSLAIIDHLDREYPDPPLVPAGGPARTRVLEIAYLIACDIHPVNNLRILKYLAAVLGADDAAKAAWYRHWIAQGFDALESLLPDRGGWCVGDAPTLADCCLVPQAANASRMSIDLSPWPRIRRIHESAQRHPAFQAAAPALQPDFIPG